MDLPFGKNTKTVAAKTLLLYKERVAKGTQKAVRLREAFVIPSALNVGLAAPEDLEPYYLYRNITFMYSNKQMQIRVEKDTFDREMFLLVFDSRIVGYFEPAE